MSGEVSQPCMMTHSHEDSMNVTQKLSIKDVTESETVSGSENSAELGPTLLQPILDR